MYIYIIHIWGGYLWFLLVGCRFNQLCQIVVRQVINHTIAGTSALGVRFGRDGHFPRFLHGFSCGCEISKFPLGIWDHPRSALGVTFQLFHLFLPAFGWLWSNFWSGAGSPVPPCDTTWDIMGPHLRRCRSLPSWYVPLFLCVLVANLSVGFWGYIKFSIIFHTGIRGDDKNIIKFPWSPL